MRTAKLLLAPVLAGLLLALFWALRSPAPAVAPGVVSGPEATAPVADSAPAPRASFTPEEVFRRAFWRHPAPSDRLVHAERVEPVDAAGEVRSWRWFLAVHPGAELLAALRSPEAFGLRRIQSGSDGRAAPFVVDAPPAWFPERVDPLAWEVLQAPGGGMTVLYRASDNLLFATDRGRGFAPPARPLATANVDRRF